MTERVPQNVYQMFVSSTNGHGELWITRTTWSNLCAKIKSVGEFTGPPPYFGNPEVLADIYTLNGRLQQADAVIPVPGTYKTWRQIPTPVWWKG